MRFYTCEFLHKWGFEDGDILMSFLHDHGFNLADVSYCTVLIRVLKIHVLPVIKNQIAWKVVSSGHNKLRITSVDGIAIDNFTTDHPGIQIEPVYVDVPDEAILAIAATTGIQHDY